MEKYTSKVYDCSIYSIHYWCRTDFSVDKSYIYDSQASKYVFFFVQYPFFFSQEKENDPKVQTAGKLVGEINPDNFTYESDFMPKVKPEIKQENHEELPLLVTNAQSLNEPPKPKVEKLPMNEAENNANKLQSNSSNTISDPKNAPIRHGPKKYGCPFCPKFMQHSGNMKLHIRSHTGEKPFSCNDCGKSFTHKGDLARHTLIHTGEQPFECDDCGKRFSLKHNLVQHKLTHTGEKPFECNDCEKSFYQKVHLKHHELRHTGEKPFSCTDCGKAFNHKASLKVHLKTVHSNC